MAPTIRPLAASDVEAVLRLNHESVHHLAPMDEVAYDWFLRHAACAWAAVADGEVAGFVLVLEPGVPYPSANYRWFSEHRTDFLYLDRVAVDEPHRRRGVGSAIYDAVEALADASERSVLLEVNARPANEPSLAFHDRRGYVEIGTLEHDDGKVVSLRERAPAPAPT